MMVLVTDSEPRTYQQAMKTAEAAEWKTAVEEELKSLEAHGVWTIEPCPRSVKPIKSRLGLQSEEGQ